MLPAIGEYHVLSLEEDCPVAISTLASAELAERIFELKPKGLSIVGKTETENIGIEKIIKNVLAVSSIKYLVLCGKDSEGHYSGDTLSCLVKNGVDDNMKVIGSKGRKAVLSNTTIEEVNSFRNQIKLVNMIDSEDIEAILSKIKEVYEESVEYSNSNRNKTEGIKKKKIIGVQVVDAEEKDPHQVKLDKAGYFVIIPKLDICKILVEHYANNNQLLRIIKGDNARNIYWTILENGWITEMSHAAYLGKELTRAELSMKQGFKYIQDKA